MSSQWQNFLRNLGEWRGSFASLDAEGALLDSTPSILTLEAADDERLVRFRLRRFGPEGYSSEPIRDTQEDYRNLGRQVVFFANGSFGKGTLQVAPGTAFGGEFGFVGGDRRHRLVQLHQADGRFQNLVLIREFRAGSDAQEYPPLDARQLIGHWQGQGFTISADWPEADQADCSLQVQSSAPDQLAITCRLGSQESTWSGRSQGRQLWLDGQPEQRLQWLPDGGYHLTPLRVSHRQAFAVEAGWLQSEGQLQRLIRRFDATGAWLSTTWMLLSRC
jgi:Domain of unknown function (DUF3598)